MLRLFVGLALPAEARQRLAFLCAGVPKARWVAPESLHLALRFIGEVDEIQAEAIDANLLAVRAPAFDLALSGVGTFEQGRRMRVLWAGIEHQPVLDHLQAKVESAAVRAGLAPEGRKFSAHVTLARFKENPPRDRLAAFVLHNASFRAGPFAVREFILYRSHLGREGAHYEALAEYPLQ
ncbi:MAG: RNA 2',3'-cyclic phosphodiesterase [Magnetospirillum sp. WYHS-4]